ncbi:MAG: excinuclease ABC subunit C [Melioribacteraceae bacterium]|nr:MAG: excinuclease ABC subunit C [Melioribacteraceae bacterium]
MNEKLKSKLESLPALPGVYQFIDKHEKIIYVGKAKNLRNRVRSYFHSTVDSPKTQVMVSKVEDFQLIVTDSEMEALVLENNLIKDLKPRYNVNLKDDKSFPYIRVTNEPFPQIFPTRDIIKDGSKYFGPYTDVKSMKASLRMINKLFKIRSCKYFIDDEAIRKKKIKVCLDYHIKKCDGPCEGLISEIEYKDMVGEVVKLLRGKTEDLINELKEKMQIASSKFKFEKAAEIRDRIDQLQVYSDKQKIVSNDFEDRDIVSAALEGKDVAATILNIRSGKLVGKKTFKLSIELNEELDKIYAAVLQFYYSEYVEVPKEIIIETEPFEKDSLIEWLNTKAMKPVKFIIPQRKSEAMSLLNMSKQNAILQLKEIQLQRMKKEGNVPYVLSALKRDLHLKNIPKKIECFDISNLQGTDTVASMVVFVEGKPKKSEYRKFIIQSVDGPDDFASMQEVIERRYSKLINENLPLPDLIMVDGGKGQLSSAVEILDRIIGKDKYEIIGLAKRLEEVILKDVSEPQSIPKTSSSLKLLQHLRDEAHRFAITFHRERRSKRTFTTELLEIKGIGKTIAEKLLKEFKSIDDIKSSSKEDLGKIIGNAKADIIVNHYSNKN